MSEIDDRAAELAELALDALTAAGDAARDDDRPRATYELGRAAVLALLAVEQRLEAIEYLS